MLKQLNDRRIENLEYQLNCARRIISELLGALTCPSEEIIALAMDLGFEYLRDTSKNSDLN